VPSGIHRPNRQDCGQSSRDVEAVAPLIPGRGYDQHARPIAVADGIRQDRVRGPCRGELTPADVDDVCPSHHRLIDGTREVDLRTGDGRATDDIPENRHDKAGALWGDPLHRAIVAAENDARDVRPVASREPSFRNSTG